MEIYFYHHLERLVAVGNDISGFSLQDNARREVFDIAHNDRLIGCELDISEIKFWGLSEY
jgi:hypothetical protein